MTLALFCTRTQQSFNVRSHHPVNPVVCSCAWLTACVVSGGVTCIEVCDCFNCCCAPPPLFRTDTDTHRHSHIHTRHGDWLQAAKQHSLPKPRSSLRLPRWARRHPPPPPKQLQRTSSRPHRHPQQRHLPPPERGLPQPPLPQQQVLCVCVVCVLCVCCVCCVRCVCVCEHLVLTASHHWLMACSRQERQQCEWWRPLSQVFERRIGRCVLVVVAVTPGAKAPSLVCVCVCECAFE